MPIQRQASAGYVAQAAIPPVAGARAGTTNPAGGLMADIDARGYKNATLYTYAGVVAASTGEVTAKVQSATAAGGSYADVTGAAVTDFGPSDDNTIKSVDFEIPAGKPFLQIVHTQSQATDLACSWLVLNGKMRN